MHNHHGQFTSLFPPIPAPQQDADGNITNQGERLAELEDSCYQCHPGTNVQCLRGAMFNGGMLCNDCHGNMQQVGADFSRDVSPGNAGAGKFVLTGNFYDPNGPQPRVPWANEPGCGSCHTGDAIDNLASHGQRDRQPGRYRRQRGRYPLCARPGAPDDAKATPIVPDNKRFAEPAIPDSFNGFANPGAGNPRLYRVSTGHGGVMCEGCHGATHAEWPNANPNANDNLTATQLQGHTGTITECGTCHANGFDIGVFINNFDDDDRMRGPHGMHPVGDAPVIRDGKTESWAKRHKDVFKDSATPAGTCQSCHGTSGQGTVLSRMAMTRTLICKDEGAGFDDGQGNNVCGTDKTITLTEGTPVRCDHCHQQQIK